MAEWLVRLVVRIAGRVLFDVRITGVENLPAGPCIVGGVPHRNWVEPFLLLGLLPAPPIWIADRRTVSRSRLSRWAARAAGGSIAVGARGGEGFEGVAGQVADALAAGRVVALFPEVGPPSKPPALRRLSPGVAHFARQCGAQVVPAVFGGTYELYLRRRIVVRILPAMPAPGRGRTELDAFMREFADRAARVAVEAHEAAESQQPRWKVGRWLTGKFPRAGS